MSTAMPVVAADLGAVREYGLSFSFFMTASLLGTVVAGGRADTRGPRGLVLLGLTLFAVGLLVSGTATGYGLLLAGRLLSGFGNGLVFVAIYVVVALVYPSALQPRVFGAISAAWVLPSLLGPPIAGFLAAQVSWRAVFLLVPPFAVLAVALLLPRLSRLPSPERAADDEPSPAAGLAPRERLLRGTGLAVGIGVLQWGLQERSLVPVAVALALAAAGGLAAVISAPGLFPAGTLRVRRGLPSLVVTRGLLTASFIGGNTFVPLMLVEQRGLSPAWAGAVITVGSMGWFAASWSQGRWIRMERIRLLTLGCAVVAAAGFALAFTPLPAVPIAFSVLVQLVGGFGMGLAMASTSVLVLRLSAAGEEGANSAALQLGDSVGTVLGIGGAGAVFAALHSPTGDDTEVYALIWVILAVVGVFCAIAATRVRRAGGVPEPQGVPAQA